MCIWTTRMLVVGRPDHLLVLCHLGAQEWVASLPDMLQQPAGLGGDHRRHGGRWRSTKILLCAASDRAPKSQA